MDAVPAISSGSSCYYVCAEEMTAAAELWAATAVETAAATAAAAPANGLSGYCFFPASAVAETATPAANLSFKIGSLRSLFL